MPNSEPGAKARVMQEIPLSAKSSQSSKSTKSILSTKSTKVHKVHPAALKLKAKGQGLKANSPTSKERMYVQPH